MDTIHEMCSELLNRGVAFRYPPERMEFLAEGGHPFPSPVQEVQTSTGPMIEEVIQPVAQSVVLDPNAASLAFSLARLWPAFQKAQLAIYSMARHGEFTAIECGKIRTLCTDEEWSCGNIEPGYSAIHPFVRLDAILIDGLWKILDINSTRPAGVGDVVAGQSILNGNMDASLRSFPMGSAFAQIVKQCVDDWASVRHLPGESVPVQIVVRETDGDWRNFENLHRVLIGGGLQAQLIEPSELALGEPTALIRSRIKEGDPAYDILKAGYPDQRCVLSPLYRRFLGNKVWMLYFRMEPFASIFRKHLGLGYEVLDEAFPDIGIVSGDGVVFHNREVDLVSLDRGEWVLKDPASSSGRRMFLGCRTGRGKWNELIARAQDGWIAQRFYLAKEHLAVAGPDGAPIDRSLFTKYGLYFFGSELAGIEFNARPDPVVHGARNTYMNPVYYRQ
ncbi:hypothetical protein ACFL0L_04860 [Patescibacteria group bacterium]